MDNRDLTLREVSKSVNNLDDFLHHDHAKIPKLTRDGGTQMPISNSHPEWLCSCFQTKVGNMTALIKCPSTCWEKAYAIARSRFRTPSFRLLFFAFLSCRVPLLASQRPPWFIYIQYYSGRKRSKPCRSYGIAFSTQINNTNKNWTITLIWLRKNSQ